MGLNIIFQIAPVNIGNSECSELVFTDGHSLAGWFVDESIVLLHTTLINNIRQCLNTIEFFKFCWSIFLSTDHWNDLEKYSMKNFCVLATPNAANIETIGI